MRRDITTKTAFQSVSPKISFNDNLDVKYLHTEMEFALFLALNNSQGMKIHRETM
jgi:hypothetical protein